MSIPIEIRQRWRLWTREDAKKGIMPQKLATGPEVNGQQPFDLFVMVGLQYRTHQKVFLNNAKTIQWSDWIDVAISKEGYDDAAPQPGGAAPPAA